MDSLPRLLLSVAASAREQFLPSASPRFDTTPPDVNLDRVTADVQTLCRLTLGVLIVAAATIGIPHRLRADRAGGRVATAVDPRWFWIGMSIVGPPVVFACVAFLIAPPWIAFAELPLPSALRLLGLPLSAAGLALFLWMFRHLGLNVTSTSMPRAAATLVTSGPYRWVRHPMYSAALLLVVATVLLTASALALLGGLGMFTLLAARSRLEEERLIEKFGADYLAYRRTTGRFFPRRASPS